MFLNELIDNIIVELDKIQFVGMKTYRLGTASCVQIRELFTSNIKDSYKNIVKMALINFAFKTYKYEEKKDNNANIIFLYSHSYCGRKEHQSSFENIISLVSKKHVLNAFALSRKTFSIRNLKSIFFYFIWLYQMRNIQIPLRTKLYLSACFMGYLEWINYYEGNIKPEEYKALVTFCDMHSYDNLLTQYFNMAGIHTTTLQHGTYYVPEQTNDTMKISLIHYTESKHLLLWGDSLRRELIEYGYNPNRLVTLGCIKYVLEPFVDFQSNKGQFGVVLSAFNKNDINHTNNSKLIMIANEYSRKYSMPYIIRMHPYNYNNYKELLPVSDHHIISKSDETIVDFAKRAEFIISDINTTVVSEMIYLERIIILYKDKNSQACKNPYGLKTFYNLSKLERELGFIYSDVTTYKKWLVNIKTEFMGSGDLVRNYQRYFSDLIC